MATERVKRKISAILSADVAGYSRLMGEDEVATVRTMESYRKTVSALIRQHNGRVIDSPGDNLLSEFASVVDAVQCGVEIQHVIKAKNADLPENRRMEFRIGINLGDVIEEGERIYGEGINIAARIEGLADPGGICISGSAYEQIASKLALGYEYLGEHTVKNISRPIRIYRIPMESGPTSAVSKEKKAGLKRFQRVPLILIAGIIIGVGSVTVWNYYLKTAPLPEVAKPETTVVPTGKPERSLSEKPSIAVLPFVNMSGDPEQEYFSDGMTEEIITRLSMNPMLLVIARNSTFTYKGKPVKVQQVGQELGVRYVVEGSVRKAGNRIRITAQLIDAATGSHLWAKTYDRELKNIFSLQDEIAHQIVTSMGAQGIYVAERARVRRIPTENLTAYVSLLRGWGHFLRLTKQDNAKAQEMFERAIELDPDFAIAYVALGAAHARDYSFGWNRDPRTLEQAFKFARKAISLDDSSFLAHTALGEIYRQKGQYEQAISQAERALSLNPNDSDTYLNMGNVFNSVGRSEEAVEAIKKAMHLNPHYPVYYNTNLAGAYRNLGQYKEAIASLKEALARNPDFIETYWGLAMNYRMEWSTKQNQDPLILDRALKMAEKTVAIDDSSFAGHYELSLVYLLKQQYEQALAEVEKLIAFAPENADSYALQAVIFNNIGRSGEAIEMVEKAMQLNPVIPAWYLNALGAAYALSARQSEAVALYKRVFDHNPSHEDAFGAHLSLAILHVALGQEEDARAEAAEILKLVPNFSVEIWGQRIPHKDHAQIDRGMAALRKAGLK